MSVAIVERAYVFSLPSRKGRFGCAFVVATPNSNTGMIAETFDFLHHVVVEDIQVVWQVRIGVDPKIIPHHDDEFSVTEPSQFRIMLKFISLFS